MIDTDSWVSPQWTRLPELMAHVRAWLRHLPPDLARELAIRNVEPLLGPP